MKQEPFQIRITRGAEIVVQDVKDFSVLSQIRFVEGDKVWAEILYHGRRIGQVFFPCCSERDEDK